MAFSRAFCGDSAVSRNIFCNMDASTLGVATTMRTPRQKDLSQQKGMIHLYPVIGISSDG